MEINKQYEAEEILTSMKQDVEVVPSAIADWWIEYLYQQWNRYMDLLSFLDNSDKRKKDTILEIGAVPGHFTVLLKRLGYNVTGVDIDPDRVKSLWTKYNILVKKADIEKDPLPIPSDSCDIVLFVEVIEHLRINPLYTLRELYRVLKPGGRIILSTPNITPLNKLDFLLGRDYQEDPVEAFKKLETLGHMGHIRLYTLREIRSLLRYAGFEISSHSYKGQDYRVGWKAKVIKAFLYFKRDQFCPYLYVIAKKSLSLVR